MILRKAQNQDYGYIKKLYREAFPLYERMPFSFMRRKHEKDKMEILVAESDSTPCALAIPSCFEDMILLNYFAVASDVRGQGIGSKVISLLAVRYSGNRIIIEIEKPDDKKPDTIRRKDFYLRNGFEETGIDIRLAGTPMEILTLGGNVSSEEYVRIYKSLLGQVFTAAMVRIVK